MDDETIEKAIAELLDNERARRAAERPELTVGNYFDYYPRPDGK